MNVPVKPALVHVERAVATVIPRRFGTSLSGAVHTVTADDVTLAGLAVSNPDKFLVLGNPFTAYSAGIAVAHDDDKFRSFINDVLEQSFEDGTWKKLWGATAGTVLGAAHPPLVNRY